MAHFELYILNYNGVRFLPACLDSLCQLALGLHTLTVNVVDNGSNDDSKRFVTERYPQFNFISLGSNLGFSNGNNAGVEFRCRELRKTGGTCDYHVFLNNDTTVERDWLLEAARIFERDEKVGIVGSKSVFFDKFLVLRIVSDNPFSPADFGATDTRILGVHIEEPIQGENLLAEPSRHKYLGAYSLEGRRRWLAPESTIFLPVDNWQRAGCASIRLRNAHMGREIQSVQVRFGGREDALQKVVLQPGESTEVKLAYRPEDYVSVVQNAGSYIKSSWEAGDRGFLEIDGGQYDADAEVAAVCGVSLFIRAHLFEELGGFERNSFAYYEDTDLSVRARLRGWKCFYAARSRLRHVHCGSGVEHSEYFTTNVTYSRLLFASKVMEGKPWRELLSRYYQNAKREFFAFEKDRLIENKPYLRAMGRYFKHPLLFRINRMHAFFKRPSTQLAGLMTD